MRPFAWIPRGLLGLGLGLGIGVGHGCAYRDQDVFAEHFGREVCRIVRECGHDYTLPGSAQKLPETSECETLAADYYTECGDRCAYDRAKARRCMRRLKRRGCDQPEPTDDSNEIFGDDNIPGACDEVYVGCEGEDVCVAPQGCSVGHGARPGPLGIALGLWVVGVRRRRRR